MNLAATNQFQTWLILLASLVAGMIVACSSADGQEPIVDSISIQTPAFEISEPVVASSIVVEAKNVPPEYVQNEIIAAPVVEATSIGAFADPAAGGQLVMTKTVCGSRIPVCVLPQDEVWLISARESHYDPCNLSHLKVCRLADGCWVNAELSELVQLHSTDKSKVTFVYAHGNRTNLEWAKARGLQFYQSALQTTERAPIRYVLFAWKSESERTRVLADFKIKSQRSVSVGIAFGKLLEQFQDREMVLAGFSLGAQVLLKGLADPALQNECGGKYRVAIFAPAIDPSFTGQCLTAFSCCPIVEKTDVFVNCKDRAVRASQVLTKKGSNSCVFKLEQLATMNTFGSNTIRIHDITGSVPRKHSIVKYGTAPLLQCKLNDTIAETFALRN